MNTPTRITVLSLLVLELAIPAGASGQSSLTNGLVAYYPFNGNANDASGNGYHATTVNAYPAPDRFGQADKAMLFLGTNRVVLPKMEPLDFNKDFSLSLWVSFHIDWNFHSLLSCSPGNPSIDIRLLPRFFPTNDLFIFSWGEPPRNAQTLLPRPAPEWWQLSVTRSGQNLALYQNGIMLTNTVMESGLDWAEMWLGQNQGGFGGLWGRLDDVRLYNRALSMDEVKELYDLEGPPLASVSGLIALDYSELKPGNTYQAQSSSDLATWENSGEPFTAVSESASAFHELTGSRAFWRLRGPQPSPGGETVPKLSASWVGQLFFAQLTAGASYQLQYSSDLIHWTNHGEVVTSTNTTMVHPEYVSLPKWQTLFYQLKPAP